MTREAASRHEAATLYRRTPAQRADQALSWARTDRAFFAAGACHILAWTCAGAHPELGLRPVGLRREGEAHAFHVFAGGSGSLACDFAGWTDPGELVAVNRAAVARERRGVEVEQVDLPRDLAVFCARHAHRLPEQFAGDVWARARAYERGLRRMRGRPP